MTEEASVESVTEQVANGDLEKEYVCPKEFNEREAMRKLYVGKINKETTEEEFKEYFSTFGEISDAVVIKKEKDEKCFGFVTFKVCDDLDEYLLKRDQHTIKGVQVEVKRAVPKENQNETSHLKTNKLFITNFAKTGMTPEIIKNYLEGRHPKKYGTIEEVVLIKKKDESGNRTDENIGYGFITCSTTDLADRIAIGEFECSLDDNSQKAEIKKAVPKGGDKLGGGIRGRGGFRGGFRGRGRGQGAPRGGGAWAGYGGGYGYHPYGGYGYGPQGGYGYGAYGYGTQDPYYDHSQSGYGQRYAPY